MEEEEEAVTDLLEGLVSTRLCCVLCGETLDVNLPPQIQ